MPDGMEPGLENTAYYDPPNLTWPFAVYIVTVEVDPDTGVWDVLKMVAVDDCGVRINPMIVEGQIMGGLTEAYAMSSMQFITFDADGNCVGSNYMDYMLPTAWETPGFELHSEVVTPCPHHPIGAKGIGECAAVGGPAAFVNAVIDALGGTGVRNIDMPLLPDRVWEAITYRRDVSGAPPVRATWSTRILPASNRVAEAIILSIVSSKSALAPRWKRSGLIRATTKARR
jgi:carbon-monoxide dehydrogenase large subunit